MNTKGRPGSKNATNSSRFLSIRTKLKNLGITRAVAGNMTYDNTPCVTVRWNGLEEHVNEFRLYEDDNEEYVAWLVREFADKNLPIERNR